MSGLKIALAGKLRYSETEGLQFSVTQGESPTARTLWLEAVPNAYEWPGIQKSNDNDAYLQALHAEPNYQLATKEFVELQRREPQRLLGDSLLWAYGDYVVRVESDEPETIRDKQKTGVMVKHYVLRRERHYERVRREV